VIGPQSPITSTPHQPFARSPPQGLRAPRSRDTSTKVSLHPVYSTYPQALCAQSRCDVSHTRKERRNTNDPHTPQTATATKTRQYHPLVESRIKQPPGQVKRLGEAPTHPLAHGHGSSSEGCSCIIQGYTPMGVRVCGTSTCTGWGGCGPYRAGPGGSPCVCMNLLTVYRCHLWAGGSCLVRGLVYGLAWWVLTGCVAGLAPSFAVGPCGPVVVCVRVCGIGSS
jgi:hypothetical protein